MTDWTNMVYVGGERSDVRYREIDDVAMQSRL